MMVFRGKGDHHNIVSRAVGFRLFPHVGLLPDSQYPKLTSVSK
jgi:hypothetical protein